MRPVDFVVIGAQKAGTTTLFHHLRRHPSLFLPADKEAPFFHRPELHAKGLDWFRREYFAGAPATATIGTVTPQYMCAPGVAPLIAEAFPSIKLIAILRDPVERAQSHHRMSVRRGFENRSFEDAIDDQLDASQLDHARLVFSENDTYVVWGEYGRVLDDYLDVFDRSQLLVISTRRLGSDPDGVMRSIHDFLGVTHLEVHDREARFNVDDGRDEKFSRSRGIVRRSKSLVGLWHRVPPRYRNRARMAASRMTRPSRAPTTAETPTGATHAPSALVRRLREHYCDDEARLERLTNFHADWPSITDGSE